MRKKNILIFISIVLFIFCIASGVYIYDFRYNFLKNYRMEDHPIIEYKDTSRLQYIAEPMLKEYLEQYLTVYNEKGEIKESVNIDERLNYYTFKHSQLVAGDSETFAVAVIFDAIPKDKDKIDLSKWGEINSKGTITCDWTLIVRKDSENNYRLLDVLKTTDTKEKLKISNDNKNIIKTSVTNSEGEYKVEGEKVYVSYDKGEIWAIVPQTFSALNYKDDGQQNSKKLDKGSYYISENKTAFMYGRGKICISDDKGETWKDISLPNGISENIESFNKETDCIIGIRRKFIGFTDDGFGYAVVSGDRAMSFEIINIYTSKDGGETWDSKGALSKEGSSLITGISFSTDKIGFITDKIKSIKITKDGGETWESIELPMPEELKGIYNTPTAPIFRGSHGELFFTQAEDDGYNEVRSEMCRFISEDYGETWSFDGEVIK